MILFYLTSSSRPIVPFTKEGLKAYFSQYNNDKSLFRKLPNNIENSPAHIKEWNKLLNKEIRMHNKIDKETNLSPKN